MGDNLRISEVIVFFWKMAMKLWLNYVKILAELELMKERFAKLLLGEDMSGSGKGVSTAVTISNAITNLYGNIFF